MSSNDEGYWFDDFSDGGTDGWENETSGIPEISENSITGDYSLFTYTADSSGDTTRWVDGPLLDMAGDFDIRALVRPEWIDSPSEDYQIRIGIASEDIQESGQNAFILFDAYNGETYLETEIQPDTYGESIPRSFADTWTRFRMVSEEDEEVLQAKVWEFGEGEPSEFQLSRDFTGVEGVFNISTGGGGSAPDDDMRHTYLDEVEIGEFIISDFSEYVFEEGNRVGLGTHTSQFVNDEGELLRGEGNSMFTYIEGSPVLPE